MPRKAKTEFGINQIPLNKKVKGALVLYNFIIDNYEKTFILDRTTLLNLSNNLQLKEQTILQYISILRKENALVVMNRTRETVIKNYRHKKYGISEQDLVKLEIESGFKCAICNAPQNSLRRKLNIDHCHTSNKIRGLLCNNCNLAIGLFEDNVQYIRNAISYLKY